jgi:hypothetical protein
MVTAWFLRLGDKLPIIRYAVSVESNRKPIFFAAPAVVFSSAFSPAPPERLFTSAGSSEPPPASSQLSVSVSRA